MILVDFCVGLAIFLYGMQELERGIGRLSGARLQRWLRDSTGTVLGSIVAGVLTTSLLQSSSVVSLMVMAFAAAGALPLVNSVGIVLGANLGTTATGWVVATLGFKLNLEAAALPMIAAAAGVLIALPRLRRTRLYAHVAFGLGFLLLGLGLMKAAMEGLPAALDVADLQGHSALTYLLVGIVLAALIQSSSAVMMMALAALDANVLSLGEAAALVIGADLGTTSTTILGSIVGSAVKRQLALAHFCFNLVVDLAAFVLLLPLLPRLVSAAGIADPLYALVGFHSLMNMLGLLAFAPFLGAFTRLITTLIPGRDEHALAILDTVPPRVTEAAIPALEQSAETLLRAATVVAAQVTGDAATPRTDQDRGETTRALQGNDFRSNYDWLKAREGDILRYALQVQVEPLQAEQAAAVENALAITRSAVYGVKTLKDIEPDLVALRAAPTAQQTAFFAQQRRYLQGVGDELRAILDVESAEPGREERLRELARRNDSHQVAMNTLVHGHAAAPEIDDRELSTALNVNREVHHGCALLIAAVAAARHPGVASEVLA